MRLEDILLIEEYAHKYKISSQELQDLHDLCSQIHARGWTDGSNDYIEDYYYEDIDNKEMW